MTHNVGSGDSFMRVMVGIAFLVNIIILEPGAIGTIILLVLTAISFVTAWTHFCSLYKPFGINTCSCGDCGEEKCE